MVKVFLLLIRFFKPQYIFSYLILYTISIHSQDINTENYDTGGALQTTTSSLQNNDDTLGFWSIYFPYIILSDSTYSDTKFYSSPSNLSTDLQAVSKESLVSTSSGDYYYDFGTFPSLCCRCNSRL